MFNPFISLRSALCIFFLIFTFQNIYGQPQVSSVSPTSGYAGTAVTITGTGFSALPADNIVYFGAVRANVTAASATSLAINSPLSATYEPISVTTNGLTAYTGFIFNTTLAQPGVFTPATLAPRSDFPLALAQDKVKSADFDNDGKPDVAFYYQLSSGIKVCRNSSSIASVTFASPASFATAYNPSEMVIADLNGDGLKDIILSFTGSNFISVLINNTAGNVINFAPVVNFAIPSGGWGVATADMDNDGKPDILFTNATRIGVLKNTSSGGIISFDAPVEIAVLSGAAKIICADLDADGKQDVVVANPGANNISIFRNTSTASNISLSAGIDFATGANPRDVAAGDIYPDGKTDIVVANNNSSSVSVFRNTSSGSNISFAARNDFATGINPTSLAIHDMNGDGKADIAAANSNASTISLLQNYSNSGEIVLSPKLDFPGGQLGISLEAVDVNGDGRTDIIGGNLGSNSFSVLLSKVNEPYINSFSPASGTTGTFITIRGLNFTHATAVSFGGINAASFSVISDTIITAVLGEVASGSVVVTNMYGAGSLTGFVYDGNSSLPPVISNFSPGSGVVASEVTITGSNFSSLIPGNIVRFGSVQANIISASSGSIKVTVPTGSTFLPLTVTSNNLTGFAARGFNVTFPGGGIPFTQSSFPAVLTHNINPSHAFFSISDFDGDGRPDYASALPGSANLQVLRNTTSQGASVSFSNQLFASTSEVNDVVSEDFNGDGKVDIAAAHVIAGTVSVLQNNSSSGNISFTAIPDYYVASPGAMSACDLNNDGKPDLLVLATDYSYTNDRVRILINTSTASAISFAPAVNFATGSYSPTGYNGSANASAIADFNGDNLPDIAVALSYTTLSILKNTSNNNSLSFATPVNFNTASWPRQIATGDVDGDGKADIAIVSSTADVVSFFRNTSDYSTGTISFAGKIDIPFTGGNAFGVAIGDIDGDAKPDIAVSQTFSPSAMALFRNISTPGNIIFEPELDIPLSNNLTSRAWIVDLNGDGKPEIATSNKVIMNSIGVAVVPVKLVSFSVQEQNASKIKLVWKTANEQNADRFQVEYSTDGNNFAAIGEVIALNIISGSTYSFIHNSPAQGINYYRLKMLDKDGRYSYSYVVRATLSGQSNQQFTVYPTSAKDFIIAEHPGAEAASLKLFTMAGVEVRSLIVNRNDQQTRIGLEGLAAGIYIATWNNGTKTMSCKFIIQ